MKKARYTELSSSFSEFQLRPVPESESFTNLSFLKVDSWREARLSAAPDATATDGTAEELAH